MNNRRIRLLCLFGILLILAACSQAATVELPELIRPVSARTDTAFAEYGSVADIALLPGVTRVRSQEIHLGSTGFRFGNFYVLPGDEVQEGQLLARMNVETLEAQINAMEESISQMRRRHAFDSEARELALVVLSLEFNDIEIDRHRLYESQARERQALELRHALEDLENLQDRLMQAELRAPFDGIITYVANRQPNQWVEPFEPLVYIAYEQDVFVELVTDYNLVQWRVQRIRGYINGRAYDLQHMPLSQEERLHYAASIPVRFAVLGNDPPPLGAYAAIHIYYAWAENALRIPANALFGNPNVPNDALFVYRMEYNQPVPVAVEIGARSDSFVAITYGLEEGDEVFVRP